MRVDFGKTAAIVITGNEVLSGKVIEQNIHYLACELRALGMNLKRVSIIPDQVDLIAEEIAFCRPRFDAIFTSGGIGPTHDDVTIDGIAKGIGRALTLHPALIELLRKHYTDQVDSALMKMAQVPEGVELIYGENLKTPVLLIENIYIFPGIPEFLRKKFSAIRERFREAPFYLTKLFLNENEEKLADGLRRALAQFPEILIGSYPVLNQVEYKVIVTLESKDKGYLEKGVQTLLALLPKESVWKIAEEGE
jgi:molybdenum cofactor synthesis domain-containing protein